MIHLKTRHVLLLLFAAVANSDLRQVDAVAVSHCNTPASLMEPQPYSITTVAHFTLASTATIPVKSTKVMLFQSIVIMTATVPQDSTPAGAKTVRTVNPSREWIFDIVDTVVMALLGLASIVVAVVLGRKQLQATRAQLQIMLDTAHRHPRVNHVEMDDLESGQHDLDGKVRSDTSVDPSAQRADSNDFLPEPEPQPHVIPNDQPPTRLRILDTEARRLASEDGFPYNESQKRGDEGQMHEKVMPAAGSCIQLDRQDSQTQDLHGRESHS
jgi:hypothetical protein